jgi:hypothetical protein
MPINYQLGKVYKIVDNTNGQCYVGSTCEPILARRLASHDYDIILIEIALVAIKMSYTQEKDISLMRFSVLIDVKIKVC